MISLNETKLNNWIVQLKKEKQETFQLSIDRELSFKKKKWV